MCDYVPGEVIVSFPRDESVVEIMRIWFDHHGLEEGLALSEEMDDRLARLELPNGSMVASPRVLWRVSMAPGDEVWAINTFKRRYQEVVLQLMANGHKIDVHEHLLGVDVSLNHYLAFSSSTSSTGEISVELTETHELYKQLIGIENVFPRSNGEVNVAIIDSGISRDSAGRVIRRCDFLRDEAAISYRIDDGALDHLGHGSVIAAVISDLAPTAGLAIYKIGDDRIDPTEWDLCAALSTVADVDVVNLSLAFGLSKEDCPACGRRANSSRSIVIENAILDLARGPKSPIVVAAAGNGSSRVLSYPARFGNVVAVGSLTSRLKPSSFSNDGAVNHKRETHANLFFLPGGETLDGSRESVGRSSGGVDFSGTSFACAYATGVIARLLPSVRGDALLEHLRRSSLDDIEGFSVQRYGNGRLRITAFPGSQIDEFPSSI